MTYEEYKQQFSINKPVEPTGEQLAYKQTCVFINTKSISLDKFWDKLSKGLYIPRNQPYGCLIRLNPRLLFGIGLLMSLTGCGAFNHITLIK